MSRRVPTLARCLLATAAVSTQTIQSPAPAQSPARVYGAGATTCATWLSGDRATRPDPVQLSWVLGYLSAVGTTVQFEREARPEWVHGVLDGFCFNRRTETLADAAQVLVRIMQTPEPPGFAGGFYRNHGIDVDAATPLAARGSTRRR